MTYLMYLYNWAKNWLGLYKNLSRTELQYIDNNVPYCIVSFTNGDKKIFTNPQDETAYLMPILNDPEKRKLISSMGTHLPEQYNQTVKGKQL